MKPCMCFIIDEDGEIQVEPDLARWAEWCAAHRARYGRLDTQMTTGGKVAISTVFLAAGDDRRLWETMVFGGEHDQDQERYSSMEEAIVGHNRWCMRVLGRPAIIMADIPNDNLRRLMAES